MGHGQGVGHCACLLGPNMNHYQGALCMFTLTAHRSWPGGHCACFLTPLVSSFNRHFNAVRIFYPRQCYNYQRLDGVMPESTGQETQLQGVKLRVRVERQQMVIIHMHARTQTRNARVHWTGNTTTGCQA